MKFTIATMALLSIVNAEDCPKLKATAYTTDACDVAAADAGDGETGGETGGEGEGGDTPPEAGEGEAGETSANALMATAAAVLALAATQF